MLIEKSNVTQSGISLLHYTRIIYEGTWFAIHEKSYLT